MRRRFTLAGLCVVTGFFVSGLIGTDIENTVIYQSFALLLALLLQACSFFFRARFSATRSFAALWHGRADAPVFRAGEKSFREN